MDDMQIWEQPSYHGPAVGGWTPYEDAWLENLWREDISAGQIAWQLSRLRPGLTRNSIMSRSHRLKLQREFPRLAGGTKSPALPRDGKRIKTTQKRKMVLAAPGGPRLEFVGQPSPEPQDGVTREGGKTLLELKSSECRWPLGAVYDPPVFFCAAPTRGGLDAPLKPYCPYHEKKSHSSGARGM